MHCKLHAHYLYSRYFIHVSCSRWREYNFWQFCRNENLRNSSFDDKQNDLRLRLFNHHSHCPMNNNQYIYSRSGNFFHNWYILISHGKFSRECESRYKLTKRKRDSCLLIWNLWKFSVVAVTNCFDDMKTNLMKICNDSRSGRASSCFWKAWIVHVIWVDSMSKTTPNQQLHTLKILMI